MNPAPTSLQSKPKALVPAPSATSASTALHNISSDPRIKEYLLGVASVLCRGNVLLQFGQFGDMEYVYPTEADAVSK